jgi:hypothetical protein
MNDPAPSPFDGLVKATFDTLDWPSLIAGCVRKDCGSFQDKFRDRAKELESAGQTEPARAARALQWMAALQMRLDQLRQPFYGLRPMSNLQLPGPDDFGEPLLAVFAEMARGTGDPEFIARLADVCWSTQKKRDFTLVAIAIEAYLASGDSLRRTVAGEKEMERWLRWDMATARLKRALQLAAMTQHALLDRVKAAFDDVFKHHLADAPLRELGLLLATYQNELEGDPALLIQIASQCASRAEEEKQWSHLRHFLRLRANWQRKAGQSAPAVATEEQRAETYLCNADENPTYHGKAHWVAKAIKAYRENSPKSSRLDDLKRLMDDYQRQGMTEMETITYPLGPAIDPQVAAKQVAGQPFDEALKQLASIAPPLPESGIREAVLQRSSDPFYALVGQDLIDWDGRVIAKRGSVVSEDPDIREHAIRAEMFRSALDVQKAVVGGFIQPARLQLLSEHNATFQDFYRVLVDSPFIPPGREYFFVRGLSEGLNGDFLIAAHLLIPQLEHALRFHLEQRGVDVTTLKDGVQEPMDLNKLFGLRREKLVEIFGADQVFELEGLLIRRHGANLRNSSAHGLFWPDQFYDGSVIYLWWVTLRLCLLHLLPAAPSNPDAPAAPTA